MGVAINGNDITVPGQLTQQAAPSGAQHVIRKQDAWSFRNYVASLDLNTTAPADLTTLSIQFSAKYIPIAAYVVEATANLSAAVLGLYTSTGGGGTAIVSPETLSGLTASGKFHQLTIASLTDPITATTLYPRLTTAAGTAGTAHLVIQYLDINDIA